MRRINLIKARKCAKQTQSDVSANLKISIRHYKALEAGTSNGSIQLWKKLSLLYGKPIDFLLEQEIIVGGEVTPPIT